MTTSVSLGSSSTAADTTRLKLRSDFRKPLESRLDLMLGKPGTTQRAKLESVYESLLTDKADGSGKQIDLDKLPKEAKAELQKLQGAAEGFESIFVKQLMAQMQAVSFDGEKKSPMANLAKDFMNQAIADSASKNGAGIGIAKTVFSAVADQVVRKVTSVNATKNVSKQPENKS